MTELVWLPEAKQDIKRLFSFLKKKNLRAAKNAILAIRAGAKQLEEYPEAGRPMNDETARRELFMAYGSGGYVLRYMLDESRVVVVRVWRQDFFNKLAKGLWVKVAEESGVGPLVAGFLCLR